MIYNTCQYCGANNGRAGLLIGSPSREIKDACKNCWDTINKGEVCIHADLKRTNEEIKKTINLLAKEAEGWAN
jgi:hypothetical protein